MTATFITAYGTTVATCTNTTGYLPLGATIPASIQQPNVPPAKNRLRIVGLHFKPKSGEVEYLVEPAA